MIQASETLKCKKRQTSNENGNFSGLCWSSQGHIGHAQPNKCFGPHLKSFELRGDLQEEQALARSATLEDTSLARRTTEQIRCLRIRWGDITHSN